MRRRAPPAAALGALALPVDALSLQPAQQLHLLGRQLLVVLVGMPGSGKSTFAEELISQHPECWRRISQDVLGSRQRCIQRAKAALREGHHVLIDRCNFDESQRRHWLGLAAVDERGETFAAPARVAVFLNVSTDEACRRVLARTSHEGGVDSAKMSKGQMRGIVRRLGGELTPPTLEEGFEYVWVCSHREETEGVLERLRSLGAPAHAADSGTA